MPATPMYYSWTLGADGNTGLSPASPKKRLNRESGNASERFSSGFTVLLAGGDIWPNELNAALTQPSNVFDPTITVQAGQYVGMYDAGLGSDRPIIDMLEYHTSAQDGLWSNIGANRWECDFTTIPNKSISQCWGRVWPGMSSRLVQLNRTPLKYMGTSAASVVAEGQYSLTGTTYTIYSPSGAPPSYYGGLAFNCNATLFGYPNTQRWTTLNGNEIRDIVTKGGRSASVMRGTNKFVNYTNVAHYGVMDFNFRVAGAADEIAERFTIRDMTADWYTSLDEGYQSLGSQEGILALAAFTTGYVRDIDIVDFNCRGARHSSVGFADTGANPAISGIVVRSTRFGRSVMDHRETNYGRGLGIQAYGYLASGILIRGQNTQSQFDGVGKLNACQWQDCRVVDPGADITNFGTDNAISIFKARPSLAFDFEMTGCVIDNPGNFSVVWATYTGDGTTQAQCRLTNNLIVDQDTYWNKRRIQHPSGDGAQIFTNVGTSASLLAFTSTYYAGCRFPTIYNTTWVLPSGVTGVYAQSAVEKYTCTSFTLNTAPPAGVYNAPVSDGQFATLAAAGLAGNTSSPGVTSPLYRAGSDAVGFGMDGNRAQRWDPPSEGAFEAI